MNTQEIESRIPLLIEKARPSVLQDYLDNVANEALLAYRLEEHLQPGANGAESLYTRVLNGVFVLDSLCGLLELPDIEARVLLTAYTVHALHAFPGREDSLNESDVTDDVAGEIERLGLPAFFLGWRDYLPDIAALARGREDSRQPPGGPPAADYRLGRDRLRALRYLLAAADAIVLSRTLAEKAHKKSFLDHLNAHLAAVGEGRQYTFITHRLAEQRGLLSNVLHEAIAAEMEETHGLLPLLYYPSGLCCKKFCLTAGR